MSPPSTIRVAIVGGGVAGASLLHALLKHPHIDADLFESATEVKAGGMAIGIARNAQSALELMGPSAAACLERAGAVAMRGVRFMVVSEGQGTAMADEVDEAVQEKRLTSIVSRGTFLRELLADVNPLRIHTSRKLSRIESEGVEGRMMLHFINTKEEEEEGTTHAFECDILIGADGIRSFVRKQVLDKDDPAANPTNSGAWFVMTEHKLDRAQAVLGKDLVDVNNPREYGWAGRDAFLMHNILNGGEKVQFSIGATDREATGSDQWERVVTRGEIERITQEWPAHLKKAIQELLCDVPQRKAFNLWDHPNARTYVSGAMCIMGDAAHATTPWQGSGAGISIEDALVLSSLLAHAKDRDDALVALQAYDEVRRPRTQRVVESSRATGALLTGAKVLDAETAKNFMSRWDFIIDLDVKEHRDEALRLMDAKLAAQGSVSG
ncbi:hypothetical protein F5Y17DRAFT_450934 [Xylariaceae sp. FL0594]|nr:hypothetical protein F5Y17DRAFT_450934 [Xylariaceae sp. FL0594]